MNNPFTISIVWSVERTSIVSPLKNVHPTSSDRQKSSSLLTSVYQMSITLDPDHLISFRAKYPSKFSLISPLPLLMTLPHPSSGWYWSYKCQPLKSSGENFQQVRSEALDIHVLPSLIVLDRSDASTNPYGRNHTPLPELVATTLVWCTDALRMPSSPPSRRDGWEVSNRLKV